MLLLPTMFFAAAFAEDECEIKNNDDTFHDINPACNYRGKCHEKDNGDLVCVCCRPYTTDNYCEDADDWDHGDWDGDGCLDYTHYLYAIVQYVFHFTNFNVEGTTAGSWIGRTDELVCPYGNNGNGVFFTGSQGNQYPDPDLIPFLQVMFGQASQNQNLVDEGYGDYDGIIVPYRPENSNDVADFTPDGLEHCRICLNGNDDCLIIEDGESLNWGIDYDPDGPSTGRHIMINFATNYNTWYSADCEKSNWYSMPTNEGLAITNPPCPDNGDDRGQNAYQAWRSAVVGKDQGDQHQLEFIKNARKAKDVTIGQDFAGNDVKGLGWSEDITLEKLYVSYAENSKTATDPNPPPSPTSMPSPSPTKSPTDPPNQDCFALGYTHTPEDLHFKGISSDNGKGCRQAFQDNWPGSKPGQDPNMCESPYVICLPAENTPNVGFPLEDGTVEYYLDDEHDYTLEECKKECAYDQRCYGFEFVGVSGQTGECMLIDDIEIDIGTSTMPGLVYDDEAGLIAIDDWTPGNLGGGRICYEKDVFCNPYFQESDLNDVMLKCYCPNNRKGFYTKNVHRTVEATTYCAGDADVTKRIREAQANRMFQLCENWCLFNVQDPRSESWYHDPWEECWREQYAGVGTHRSYCFRVIRDPMTIEQQYIDERSSNMCNHQNIAPKNTPSPVWAPVNQVTVGWMLADEYDSCDDKCAMHGQRCAQDMMVWLTENWYGNAPDQAKNAFDDANVECNDVFTVGDAGWAFPGINAAGECILRNDATDADTGCNLAIGKGYQRLCPCSFEGIMTTMSPPQTTFPK